MATVEEKIFSQLLALSSRVAELVTKVDRMQAHVEAQSTRLATINDRVVQTTERTQDHTMRISKLEVNDGDQEKLRHRLGGMWIGVAVFASVLASAAAIVASFYN